MKKLSKTEAKKKIQEFFSEIKNSETKDKTPKEVKKIKRLSMKHNIPLKEKRKLFCKKCLAPYKNPKIRIKNKAKTTVCENCGYAARWKIK